jgi:hypothetical protein
MIRQTPADPVNLAQSARGGDVSGGDEGAVRDGLRVSSPFLCRGVREGEGAGEARQSKRVPWEETGFAQCGRRGSGAKLSLVRAGGWYWARALGEYRYRYVSQIRGSGCYQHGDAGHRSRGNERRDETSQDEQTSKRAAGQTSSDGRGKPPTMHVRLLCFALPCFGLAAVAAPRWVKVRFWQ